MSLYTICRRHLKCPVLLSRLFEAGVTWRLFRSWYDGAVGCVRSGSMLSGSFEIGRGVRQGSVLSLFLLVMDIPSKNTCACSTHALCE